MVDEVKERNYSDDEIEQILGMGGPETKLRLKEMREVIRENPLLVATLVFTFGVLVGVSLSRGRRRL
jgi:hypothetical protein